MFPSANNLAACVASEHLNESKMLVLTWSCSGGRPAAADPPLRSHSSTPARLRTRIIIVQPKKEKRKEKAGPEDCCPTWVGARASKRGAVRGCGGSPGEFHSIVCAELQKVASSGERGRFLGAPSRTSLQEIVHRLFPSYLLRLYRDPPPPKKKAHPTSTPPSQAAARVNFNVKWEQKPKCHGRPRRPVAPGKRPLGGGGLSFAFRFF